MTPNAELIQNVFKIFGLSAVAFFFAFAWTPLLTHFLYKYRMWRKSVRIMAPDGAGTPIFAALHQTKETRTPRLGGLLIWITVVVVIFAFWLLAKTVDGPTLAKLNFLSRNQTWLPLFTLVAASLLGLADDLLQIWQKGGYVAGGLKFRARLGVVFLIALVGAWWFYAKLGQHTLYLPGAGDLDIGIWFIPLFIVTMFATFSTGVTDGLDGLAAFSAVVLGALFAFLWFNIPPARFYMGETGILGLTSTLTVIAFLTNSVIVLPIIAFVPAAEAASVILQLLSKRFRGKKIFLVAPVHHHFEAIGWPSYKVTMRFWIMSAVFAIIGMVVALVGR